MNPPKKLEELSVLEINAEIGLRMELVERTVFELNELRKRRQIQAEIETKKTPNEA